MPWMQRNIMSLRLEFVKLASQPGANVRQLCRRFGISQTCAYKWIARFGRDGTKGLADRSRRPHSCPHRTDAAMERAVRMVRADHPAWGGRKIHRRLLNLGYTEVPQPSTITQILHRNGQIDPRRSQQHKPFVRFEHKAPNELWQMDFKGHFALHTAQRCHPLTVLDDHSRFSVGLFACSNQRTATVADHLTGLFRRYGLPERMLMDNGPPWGSDAQHKYTRLTVWLMRLGIGVVHCRPFHPQTQGKDERFHRTLKAELLRYHTFENLSDCQHHFDPWRHTYNHQRPHEALDMAVPASRYRASSRSFPEQLDPIQYGPSDIVRKVHDGGRITYKGHNYKVGRAFVGYPVAMRPTDTDGQMEIYFLHHRITQIDLTATPQGG